MRVHTNEAVLVPSALVASGILWVGIRSARGAIRVSRPKPVKIEVLAYAPTVFYHCQHCELTFQQMGIGDRVHREHAKEALPDDLREEFHVISDWIHELHASHGRSVEIKVVDAASIEGVFKSVKHRAHRYPTVIVQGKDRYVRPDLRSLRSEIDERVQRTAYDAAAKGGDASD